MCALYRDAGVASSQHAPWRPGKSCVPTPQRLRCCSPSDAGATAQGASGDLMLTDRTCLCARVARLSSTVRVRAPHHGSALIGPDRGHARVLCHRVRLGTGSRECQKREWRHHKHECGSRFLASLRMSGEGELDAMLLGRVLRDAVSKRDASAGSAATTFDGVPILTPTPDDVFGMVHNVQLSRQYEPAQVAAREGLVRGAVASFLPAKVTKAFSAERMVEVLTACVGRRATAPHLCAASITAYNGNVGHAPLPPMPPQQVPVEQLRRDGRAVDEARWRRVPHRSTAESQLHSQLRRVL